MTISLFPIALVSGFPGAGKTTFISAMEQFGAAKINRAFRNTNSEKWPAAELVSMGPRLNQAMRGDDFGAETQVL